MLKMRRQRGVCIFLCILSFVLIVLSVFSFPILAALLSDEVVFKFLFLFLALAIILLMSSSFLLTYSLFYLMHRKEEEKIYRKRLQKK